VKCIVFALWKNHVQQESARQQKIQVFGWCDAFASLFFPLINIVHYCRLGWRGWRGVARHLC
jgi:hypothetical protein